MKNHALIADAHTLANQQLERLRILTLLLPEGRSSLPESQIAAVDVWMFEMIDSAQDCLRAAADALANLKGDAK